MATCFVELCSTHVARSAFTINECANRLPNSENLLLSNLFGGSGSKKRRDRKRGGNLAVDVTVSDKMLRASMKRVRESLAKTKKFTVAYTFKVWPCGSHSFC